MVINNKNNSNLKLIELFTMYQGPKPFTRMNSSKSSFKSKELETPARFLKVET